jgi:hypothetical protein
MTGDIIYSGLYLPAYFCIKNIEPGNHSGTYCVEGDDYDKQYQK